jgi:hypothetical protein
VAQQGRNVGGMRAEHDADGMAGHFGGARDCPQQQWFAGEPCQLLG